MKLFKKIMRSLAIWTSLGVGTWVFLTANVSGIERRYMEMLAGRPTGILPWELREISGLAHCRSTPEHLWAINDRGSKATIHALSLKAELKASFRLYKDSNKDWEDLACGRCANSVGECLYIGDIGSNSESRKNIKIYMIPLPLKFEELSKGKSVFREKFSLKYPKGKHNAEALLVHPEKPIILIVTKKKSDPRHRVDPKVFTTDLSHASSAKKTIMTYSGTIPLTKYLTKRDPPASAWITGGDFYPTGKWFLLMTYTHLYRVPWPIPDEESDRIIIPIWGNVNRTKIESVALHPNGKQFWIGSEISRSREPLLLMELPLH
ncbi:MAG: hypothetical protein HQM13_00775 [SAR324 cluster bacterium]|nr:hypothetical protein [SAR324 cluster bacterium]